MKVEVKIRNNIFQAIVPEFEINEAFLSDSLIEGQLVKADKKENKARAPVNIPGAPDLYEFKEKQEDLLKGAHQEKSEDKTKKKRRFRLFKKRKKQPEPSILELLPEETMTTVLDGDVPFAVLESRNKLTGDIIVDKEAFPIGRVMDCLKEFDFISRCHGLIYAEDYQHIYFGDTSQNFNYINGQRLKHFEYYELKNNDILSFRDLQYVVKMGDNHG